MSGHNSNSNNNSNNNTTTKNNFTTAVGLSLASAILIIMNSLLSWLFIANMNINFPMGNMMRSMGSISPHGFTWWWTVGEGFVWIWVFPLMLVIGLMILFGAILMYMRPKEKKIGGVIVLVFSAIGFAGMGFSIIGAIIGIIGGVAALAEKQD